MNEKNTHESRQVLDHYNVTGVCVKRVLHQDLMQPRMSTQIDCSFCPCATATLRHRQSANFNEQGQTPEAFLNRAEPPLHFQDSAHTI